MIYIETDKCQCNHWTVYTDYDRPSCQDPFEPIDTCVDLEEIRGCIQKNLNKIADLIRETQGLIEKSGTEVHFKLNPFSNMNHDLLSTRSLIAWMLSYGTASVGSSGAKGFLSYSFSTDYAFNDCLCNLLYEIMAHCTYNDDNLYPTWMDAIFNDDGFCLRKKTVEFRVIALVLNIMGVCYSNELCEEIANGELDSLGIARIAKDSPALSPNARNERFEKDGRLLEAGMVSAS